MKRGSMVQQLGSRGSAGRRQLVWIVASTLLLMSGSAVADDLRGSSASLDRQNRVARQHDYTYIATPAQVRYFVERGWLVPVRGNRDLRLSGVSFPYARPEVEMFVRRLGAQYRAACGRRLVVTSLTRPLTRQPRNASDRSVHPTGMALDLRYSRDHRCRRWLQSVLLDLERAGVLDVTLERRPIHYHVALFPRPYASYVAGLEGPSEPVERETEVLVAEGEPRTHRVRPGDSLWTISRANGLTVRELRELNDLRSSRLRPGQVLRLGEAPIDVAVPDPKPKPEVEEPSASPETRVADAGAPSGPPPAGEPGPTPSTSPEAADSASAAPESATADPEAGEPGTRGSSEPAAGVVVVTSPATESASRDDAVATYTVQRGDSLWTIARAHGLSVRELRRLNAKRSSRIKPGEVLQVSGTSTDELRDALVSSYTVQPGDSLWTIARAHGTTVRDLRRANAMRGSRIFAGQVLQIPPVRQISEGI